MVGLNESGIVVQEHYKKLAKNSNIVFLVVLIAAGLIYKLRILIICVWLALTLAAAITPLAKWGEMRRIPRILTVLIIYLFVGSIYSFGAAALFPELKKQAVDLHSKLPEYMYGLTNAFPALTQYIGQDEAGIKVSVDQVRQLAPKFVTHTISVSAGILGALANSVLVLFITAYFVVEAPKIWPKLFQWIPKDKRKQAEELIYPLETRLGGYVRGQFLVSLVVATIIGTGLTFLGVKHALVLGVLAGLFNLVPFAGSAISMVLSAVVAVNQSLALGGLVIIMFAFEQWLESTFIVPYFLGKQVSLHPLLVLFSIIIGATIMGLPGALVAVPLCSVLFYLAQEFYLKPLNSPDNIG